MRTALVIGFGPFPGAPRNPSAELVRALGRRRRPALAGVRIVTAVLPTAYAAVADDLPALIARHDPDLVLFFGLAARAKFLRIESRAVNAVSAVHPDARRTKLATRQIIPGAPPALKVRAALQRAATAAHNAGVAARHSRDAGRYICNAALFTALDMARRADRPQVAFVHIPRPRGRGGSARPTLDQLVRAGEAVLVALAAEARFPGRPRPKAGERAGVQNN